MKYPFINKHLKYLTTSKNSLISKMIWLRILALVFLLIQSKFSLAQPQYNTLAFILLLHYVDPTRDISLREH